MARVGLYPSQQQKYQQQPCQKQQMAFYFTNTEEMKKMDPYAQLGLTWGATTTEIKEAYKQLARKWHPDMVDPKEREEALQKFQSIQWAYQRLLDFKNRDASHDKESADEWSFTMWRAGDVLAQQRTDVAGVARKRPMKPADAFDKPQWGVGELGHPNGGGVRRRGELLGSGSGRSGSGSPSSTVGTGQNKWVTPKPFVPWNPNDVKFKGVSKQQQQQQQQQQQRPSQQQSQPHPQPKTGQSNK
jgi:curved DNA-binding protein CbpA